MNKKLSIVFTLVVVFGIYVVCSVYDGLAETKPRSPWQELKIDPQPFNTVHFLLAKHHHSFIGQSFTVVIKNVSQHRQRVTGKLVASLIPSSTKVEEFDVTLKPGEKRGGDPFLLAEIGLSGVVMKEDAEGERVPDPENPTKTVINRIRSLSLKDVRVVDLDAQEEAENRAQEAKAEERQRNEELARRRAAELERQNQIKRQRQEQEAKERARREEQQQVQADQQQRYNNSMRQMQDDLTRTLTRGTRAGADKECLGCNGKGNVSCAFCFGQGTVVGFPKPTECGVCKGSGRAPCILCGGSGQKKF